VIEVMGVQFGVDMGHHQSIHDYLRKARSESKVKTLVLHGVLDSQETHFKFGLIKEKSITFPAGAFFGCSLF
jgi:hypothetical protein